MRLAPQRRSNRWNLYFDNGQVLGVSTTLLADFHLKKGDNFTRQQFLQLEIASWQEKSYQKALRLLARRQQAENEIKRKLEQYLYRFLPAEERENVIGKVAAKLQAEGLVNDLEFSRWWVSQHLSRGWSRRQLWQELRRKGVSKEIAEQALADYREKESFRNLLRKRRKQWQNLPGLKIRQKIWFWGRARGFGRETIEEVIDEILDNR